MLSLRAIVLKITKNVICYENKINPIWYQKFVNELFSLLTVPLKGQHI